MRAVVLGLACICPAAAGQVTELPREVAVGRPKLVVDERTIDLGRIREGDIVEAVFTIRNEGDQELAISELRSTCACTIVELTPEEKRVAPAGSVPIEVVFNSKGYPGQQTRSIVVVSNDLVEPQIALSLAVYVDSVFRLVPPGQIDFRNVRRGQIVARSVEVTPAEENATLELVSVSTGSTALTYTAQPATSGTRQGYKLDFTVTPEAPIGPLLAEARITARVGQETAEQVLRIIGEVVGDITAQPLTVYEKQPILPGHQLRVVKVLSPGKHPFRVLAAEAGPNIVTTIRPGKIAGEFEVRLTIGPQAPAGPFGTTLAVRTDHPDQPLLRIPVFAHVAPRVSAEPPMVVLSGGSDARRERRVKFETGDLMPFKLTGVSVDPPIVAARSEPRAEGQEAYVQFVTLTVESSPTQESEATLIVTTDLPDAAEVRVPVAVWP